MLGPPTAMRQPYMGATKPQGQDGRLHQSAAAPQWSSMPPRMIGANVGSPAPVSSPTAVSNAMSSPTGMQPPSVRGESGPVNADRFAAVSNLQMRVHQAAERLSAHLPQGQSKSRGPQAVQVPVDTVSPNLLRRDDPDVVARSFPRKDGSAVAPPLDVAAAGHAPEALRPPNNPDARPLGVDGRFQERKDSYTPPPVPVVPSVPPMQVTDPLPSAAAKSARQDGGYPDQPAQSASKQGSREAKQASQTEVADEPSYPSRAYGVDNGSTGRSNALSSPTFMSSPSASSQAHANDKLAQERLAAEDKPPRSGPSQMGGQHASMSKDPSRKDDGHRRTSKTRRTVPGATQPPGTLDNEPGPGSGQAPPSMGRRPSLGSGKSNETWKEENNYLKRNVDNLKNVKHELQRRVRDMEKTNQFLQGQVAHYRAAAEQAQRFTQGIDQGTEAQEICNLQDQLSAVVLIKDALNSENLELQRRLEDEMAKSQAQSAASSASCTVCMDNLANLVCLPCKHLALCTECGGQENLNNCPMCRAPVREKMQIYPP